MSLVDKAKKILGRRRREPQESQVVESAKHTVRATIADIWASWFERNPFELVETALGWVRREHADPEDVKLLRDVRQINRGEKRALKTRLGGRLLWNSAMQGMAEQTREGYTASSRAQGSPWGAGG